MMGKTLVGRRRTPGLHRGWIAGGEKECPRKRAHVLMRTTGARCGRCLSKWQTANHDPFKTATARIEVARTSCNFYRHGMVAAMFKNVRTERMPHKYGFPNRRNSVATPICCMQMNIKQNCDL